MSWLIKISRNKLKLLYLNKKLSSRKIAKEFNCSKAAILERLHQYNIPLRKAKLRIINIPKSKLKHLYINQRLSIYKIAEIFNTNPVLIHNRMREYGIPARSISDALKGRVPWNKGGHLLKETRRKLSKVWKRIWKDQEFREKMAIRNKNISERMKGDKNPMKNPEISEIVRRKIKGKLVGDKNPAKKLKSRRKISKALKGHEVPPAVKKKIAESLIGRYTGELNPFYGKHHTVAVKKKSRMSAIKQLISGEFKNRITSIELKMEKELRKRSIYYKKQFPLLNRTVVDFYLPKHKVVIYCDGTFWHSSKWAEKQGVKEKDRKQNKILIANGYKVFRFPEMEINQSPKKCVDKVIKYINRV